MAAEYKGFCDHPNLASGMPFDIMLSVPKGDESQGILTWTWQPPQIKIGGWAASPSLDRPERRNRFRLRLRLSCLCACVRAKLRKRDGSAVVWGGQSNLSGWSDPPSRSSWPNFSTSCYVCSWVVFLLRLVVNVSNINSYILSRTSWMFCFSREGF